MIFLTSAIKPKMINHTNAIKIKKKANIFPKSISPKTKPYNPNRITITCKTIDSNKTTICENKQL